MKDNRLVDVEHVHMFFFCAGGNLIVYHAYLKFKLIYLYIPLNFYHSALFVCKI